MTYWLAVAAILATPSAAAEAMTDLALDLLKTG